MATQGLIIKDGNATTTAMQVDSGSSGLISNHTLVSTVSTSDVNSYYEGGPDGWTWGDGIVQVTAQSSLRKSIVISNNSESGKCYVLMGNSDFGTIPDIESPPPKYAFLLDSGATYFGDQSTAALEHHIYVPSSSYAGAGQMTVTVTQVY